MHRYVLKWAWLMIFATGIEEILTLGHTYGSSISGTPSSAASDVASFAKHYQISLIHYSTWEGFTHTAHSKCHSKDVVSSNTFTRQEGTETHTAKTRTLNQLNLSEGRSLLVLGLLRKLLEARGHFVSCHTNIPQVCLPPSLLPLHNIHPMGFPFQ